jgi:hypothetical protein
MRDPNLTRVPVEFELVSNPTPGGNPEFETCLPSQFGGQRFGSSTLRSLALLEPSSIQKAIFKPRILQRLAVGNRRPFRALFSVSSFWDKVPSCLVANAVKNTLPPAISTGEAEPISCRAVCGYGS